MASEPIQAVATPTPAPTAAAKKAHARRRGVVLIAVLVVVAALALAGYHYSDMMVSEDKAAVFSHRNVQAKAFADSGIHYAAGMLSNPDSYANILGNNPWNNPAVFQNVLIQGDGNVKGYFSIIAPPSIDDPSSANLPIYGVSDEGGKINLNAIMKMDPSGQILHDILVKLPNMTEDIANAIIDWLDSDSDPRPGGAESDYYMALSPPYRCKNGPIDSIDELLLVKGVTRDLLYGTDLNRNGFQDANEIITTTFDRGWSAYLTVHSREQNNDQKGVPYVFLNDLDLTQLYNSLKDIDDDTAKFIIMFRQYPTSTPTGQTKGTVGTILAALGIRSSTPSTGTVKGTIADYQLKLTKAPSYNFASLFDLINTQVTIPTYDKNTKKTTSTVYASPLNDIDKQRALLPKLFALCTLDDPLVTQELPARININTAPRAVLNALATDATGLTANDIDNIFNTRQLPATPDDIFNSPTWLLTEAGLPAKTLAALDKLKLISTRTQVYRVQSVGYFDGKGPTIRIEAVIDTNMGRPRILAWRDLSELGKGLPDNPPSP